jgi:hypothetical protein
VQDFDNQNLTNKTTHCFTHIHRTSERDQETFIKTQRELAKLDFDSATQKQYGLPPTRVITKSGESKFTNQAKAKEITSPPLLLLGQQTKNQEPAAEYLIQDGVHRLGRRVLASSKSETRVVEARFSVGTTPARELQNAERKTNGRTNSAPRENRSESPNRPAHAKRNWIGETSALWPREHCGAVKRILRTENQVARHQSGTEDRSSVEGRHLGSALD